LLRRAGDMTEAELAAAGVPAEWLARLEAERRAVRLPAAGGAAGDSGAGGAGSGEGTAGPREDTAGSGEGATDPGAGAAGSREDAAGSGADAGTFGGNRWVHADDAPLYRHP